MIGSLLLDKLQKILLKEQEKHHSNLQHNALTKYERKESLHSVTCLQPSGGLSPPVNDHLTGNKTDFLCNYNGGLRGFKLRLISGQKLYMEPS